MKTESLDKIRRLKTCANALTNFWSSYSEDTSRGNVDKHQAKFNGDNRWLIFKKEIFFEAHTGTYGNSSCSTFGNLDGDLCPDYFLKAIQKNKEIIFSDMAQFMLDEAKTLTEKAESEIAELTKLLDFAKGQIDEVKA